MSSGTIPLSMTQQFDVMGKPLAGGQLYIMQSGTVSTPQNPYQDPGLTILMPNPIPLDAAGRIPQFFIDNTVNSTVKIRLQDKHGVVQLASDNILVIGPSSGSGGGGATIDATTVFQTGDMKARYSTGVHPGASPGWVRANGLTIGSAASSPAASERGNADCQALFMLLWGADATLAVSGTRGASAAADWTANKTIATPDYRGYALAALDGMGNSAAGRLGSYFANADILGSAGGTAAATLAQSNLPNVAPAFTGTLGAVGVTSGLGNIIRGTLAGPNTAQTGGGTGVPTGSAWFSSSIDSFGNFTPAGTISSINAAGPSGFGIISPRKLCTIYLKL